jgi:hypothetical protein
LIVNQTDPTAALARIRQMADYWEQNLPEVIRTPAVVSALRAAMEPAAASAVVSPQTDRAGLRDRIAEALAVADGWEYADGLGFRDMGDAFRERYLAFADAVLALLPPPADQAAETAELRAEVEQWRATFGRDALPGALRRLERAEADRAAVLEETATALEAQTCTCGCRRAAEFIRQRAAVIRAQDARRLADEAQPAPIPAPRTTQDAYTERTAPEIVAYRSRDGRQLRCLAHAPAAALVGLDWAPLTGLDVEGDASRCTDCGADVLADEAQPVELHPDDPGA